jgi:hypothetical protein
LIGQPILHDEPHGQRHHTMGVAGFGQTILRSIRVKELVARAATMLGIEQFDVAGSSRNQVPTGHNLTKAAESDPSEGDVARKTGRYLLATPRQEIGDGQTPYASASQS